MHDRLNYNSNIFNNIFIRWLLVFVLIFIVFIKSSSYNVSADCGNYYPDEDVSKIDLSNIDNSYNWNLYLNTCKKWSSEDNSFIVIRSDSDFKKYNQVYYFLIKWRGTLNFDKSYSGLKFFVTASNYTVFYIKDLDKDKYGIRQYSNFYKGDSSSFDCTTYQCGLSNVNLNNISIIYSNIRDSDSLNGYDGELPKENINIDKDDVNTYPVGHLEIINPSGALNINYSNKYNAYPVDVKVKGKIPFQIRFGQESEISADKIKSILQKEIYNTMNFTMIGSNNTYTRSDKTFLNDNDPKLVVFGTKSDWIDNEYLTFEYTFKLYLKDKGDYNFNSFTINVPTWWEHTFFGIGTDKFKDFKADDVKFSINAYKDLNGDGVDDETGEVIPPQTDLDVDDDDWDHMTFLEKAEYLITSIPSFLGNIFDSLINTIANTVQLVNSVVAQGGTIAGLVTNLFDFFPAPIPQMITVTIGVMIFITFLSWVKK